MTRGLRNKNPFNIKLDFHNNWKGKVPEDKNTDFVFEQFVSLDYGIRAGILLLHNYINSGCITIEDIINRFAPDNENDTKSYVHSVLVFLHSRNVKVEEGIIVDGDWLNVEIISHDVAPDSIVRFGTDLFYHLCLAIMFIESNYLTTIDALKSITNSFNIF